MFYYMNVETFSYTSLGKLSAFKINQNRFKTHVIKLSKALSAPGAANKVKLLFSKKWYNFLLVNKDTVLI